MKILKIISYVLVLILTLSLGYSIGVFHHKKSARIGYKIGVVSFCDLEEADRLKVCPLMRFQKEIESGGSAILYVCSQESGFIETNSLTKKSAKLLESLLNKIRKKGGQVEEVCSTENGVVYEIWEFAE